MSEIEEIIEPEGYQMHAPCCLRLKWDFQIINGKCDSCLIEAQRTLDANAYQGPVIGMDDVYLRRDRLLGDSDCTQVDDRPESVKQAFVPWRQEIRNITQLPNIDAMWARLQELEDSRPSESAGDYP